MTRKTIAMIILLCLGAALVAAQQSRPIAFSSARDGLTGNTRRDRDVWLLWPDSGTLERITRNDWADGSASVSADGRYIAWTEEPGDVPDDQTWITVMDRNDNTSRRLVIDGDLGAHMQFRGNSHDLVTTSQEQIVGLTLDGDVTPLRQVSGDHRSPWIAGLTVANSGEWTVMVRVIDPPREAHEAARVNGRVDVSKLERFEELVLLDRELNEVEVLVRGKRSNWSIGVFHGQDISDDGNIVVYGLWNNDEYDFDTVLLDRRTGQTRVIAPRAASPQLSPDARQVLVVASPGDTSPGLFVLDRDGTGMRRLTPPDEYSAEASW